MPNGDIERTSERMVGDVTSSDIFRLRSQVDALSLMKGSALTRAIMRINFIMPVRGIVTLS